MLDLKGKKVGLIGYGVSNRALCGHLLKMGESPVIRCKDAVELPRGAMGVFGNDYLDTDEEIVFRSPSVRPDKIGGSGQVLTEAEYALRQCPAFKIGVSGSDGKTTTSTLIYRMLCQGGKNGFLGGNIGFPLINYSTMLSSGDYLVAELSSFQLFDMNAKLQIGALTNISENHLDWHTNMDEYVCAKRKIVENSCVAVLNYDDPTVRALARDGDVYFSLEDLSHLVGKRNVVHVVDGYVCYNSECLFQTREICLQGRYNLQNVLCAVACTYEIVGKEACRTVAREFCGVEGRQELIGEVGGVKFISSAIDSTPTRTKNTLSAFDKSRVVCILGGYDKNLCYDILCDTLKDVKGVVLCGENSDKIDAAIKRHAVKVNTLDEAVSVAYKMATEGDFVILSPASASFDMFKNYREKASCFKSAAVKCKMTQSVILERSEGSLNGTH